MNTVTRYCSFGVVMAAAAMMVACGGGAGGPGVPGGSGMSPDAQLPSAVAKTAAAPQGAMSEFDKSKHKKKGEAKFIIKIPPYKFKLTPLPLGKHLQHGKSLHPKYISPSTLSMTVAVAGQPTQTFNLTPSSPNCSTGAGGYVTCSESGFFPSGQQTITVTLYDQQNGAGDALSTASTTVTIVAGGITQIPITLNGVVATAVVLLNGSSSDSVPFGTATSVPVTVNAYDAKGNLIVSPGNYDASTPVTLSNSDSSGVTSLSSTSVSGPGASLTLSYNGGNVSSATITAKVNGVSQAGPATLTITGASTPAPVASPGSLNFSTAASQTFNVTETGYSGTLTPSGCSGVASVSPSSANGPNATFTVTPVAGGTCTITITDSHSNTATVSVTVNGGVIIIDPTPTPVPAVITEYPIPTGGSHPRGIATGPDGALWFAECSAGKIGQITTNGTVTAEYPTGGGTSPEDITTGPNGALWFTLQNTPWNQIAQISTVGAITEYSIGSANVGALAITTGSDGALWFAECGHYSIGTITTSGAFTEYTLPMNSGNYPAPTGITAGPDGALWFALHASTQGVIGRITTSGMITEYSIPTSGSRPSDITAGPDGALWFTDSGLNSVGRITTTGAITEYSLSLSPSNSSTVPNGIAAGPDGALWFAQTYGGSSEIGRITTSGTITEYPTPTSGSGPKEITAGPDGAMWFTEYYANQIGRIPVSIASTSRHHARLYQTGRRR